MCNILCVDGESVLTVAKQASVPQVRSRHNRLLWSQTGLPHWQGTLHPLFTRNPSLSCCISQYNDGIPAGSRYATAKEDWFEGLRKRLTSPEGQEDIRKVRELTKLAENGTILTLPVFALFSHVRDP